MAEKKKGRPNAPTPSRTGKPLPLSVLALLLAAGLAYLFWPRQSRLNLVFVTIDTLRADHVGAWGNAQASTPVLDGLAAGGVRFANAEAAVPLTGPSHATIFTGNYPPAHGVRDNVAFPLDPRHATLAALLKGHGYRTAAFVAAYTVAKDFGFGQGFDEYHESFHQVPIPGHGAERPGNEVADEAIAWLSRGGEGPFFVWIHLYDPHAPYTPPSPYLERFPGRPYDGEVAFADAQVGRVLEALRGAGREKDTLIVAMADHGESLGEHGEATHAILVYESTLHVPLIVSGPEVPRGVVVRDRVGAVDVLPTVLGLLGVPAPAGLPGRDLRATFRGGALPAEALYGESLFGRLNCRWSSLRVLTLGDWKLIHGAGTELYDLAADPGETRDRSVDDPDRVSRMRRLLEAALAKLAPQGDSARTAAISPEQEERLRSLGYAAGSGGGGSLDEPGLPDPRTHVQLYERIQSATQARGADAVERAIAEMSAIAERDPGNPYAHYALGNMAYRHGRLALADKAYARTLELDPDRPAMRTVYGRLLRDLGRLPEAERQVRIAVEQTTANDVRTRATLADILLQLGKTEEAARIVDDLLSREPNHVDARRSKGRLLVATGRVAEGLGWLEKAAAGSDPEPWIEIARLRLEGGDPAGALSAAEQAVSRNRGHPWALAMKGHALVAAGRRGEGMETLKRALAAGPRRPEVWLTLSRAFESAGESTLAAHCRRQLEASSSG